MRRKVAILLSILTVSILMFGSVTGISIQVLDLEERDLDTLRTYDSDNRSSVIKDVRINLDNHSVDEETIIANITYTFDLKQKPSEITVRTTEHVEEIETIRSDNENRTITVRTQYQSDNHYNKMFHSSTSLFLPRVRLVVSEDIGRNGFYTPIQIVRYSDYTQKVSSVSSSNDASSIVTDNTLILNTDQSEYSNLQYGIVSNRTTKQIRITDSASQMDVLEISEVAGTLFALDGFNTTHRINMIYTDDITSAGYIRHLSDRSSNIYINKHRSSKYVISHEIAHSIQNFNTLPTAYWWIEGSAEYLSALIGENSGMTKTEAENYAFSNNWVSGHNLNASLIKPKTWTDRMEYNRGARLSYVVDMKIREHTNKTILDLIERLNDHDDNIDHSVTRSIIEDMTTPQFADQYDELVKQNRSIDITETLDTDDYELPPLQIDRSEVKIIKDDDSK